MPFLQKRAIKIVHYTSFLGPSTKEDRRIPMADLIFFRRYIKQKSEAMPDRCSRPQILNHLRRGVLRFLLLPSLICSLQIVGSSHVVAQSLPGTLSEIIFKRLEGRRPPVPEFTLSSQEQIFDPNGSS